MKLELVKSLADIIGDERLVRLGKDGIFYVGYILIDTSSATPRNVGDLLNSDMCDGTSLAILERYISKIRRFQEIFRYHNVRTINEVVEETRMLHRKVTRRLRKIRLLRKRHDYERFDADVIGRVSGMGRDLKVLIRHMSGAVYGTEPEEMSVVYESLVDFVCALEDAHGVKKGRRGNCRISHYENNGTGRRRGERIVALALYLCIFEKRPVDILTKDRGLPLLLRESCLALASTQNSEVREYEKRMRQYTIHAYLPVEHNRDVYALSWSSGRIVEILGKREPLSIDSRTMAKIGASATARELPEPYAARKIEILAS